MILKPLLCRGALALWLTLLSLHGIAAAATPSPLPRYSLGVVPQYDARQLHSVWQPLADALGRRLGIELSFTGSPSIGAFEQAFMDGAYDFAYMNPYHALVAYRTQGYVPLARDTARALTGILVVRRDSDIHSLADLDGHRIAFPSPNALGAALIPRAEFARIHHLNIQPWYVGNHDSVYLNVVLGQVAAGGGVRRTLDEQPAQIRSALRIIYETQPVPAHPIVAHPRVPAELRRRMQAALLELGRSAEGRALLAGVPIQSIGPASIADYLPLEALGLEEFFVRE